MRHHIVGGMAAAVLLVACGQGSSSNVAGSATPDSPPEAGPTTGSEEPTGNASEEQVECGGAVFNLAVLTDAPDASTLAEGPAGAVDDVGAPAFDPTEGWKVVYESDDRVDLVRELDEPIDQGGGDVRTHEALTLERITGASNIADGTWLLTSAGPCASRVVAAGIGGAADLTLAEDPSPEATVIRLLVHERSCASGQSADGRIALLELEETSEQVRLRIGVRPLPGGQDCQGNPPTPFSVQLLEPLGDREIVDTAVAPPRPLVVDPVIGDG